MRLEKLVEIDADHNKICCIKIGSRALNEISTFLETAAEAALGRIKKGSNECKESSSHTSVRLTCIADKIPPDLDQQTVRSDRPSNDFEQMGGEHTLDNLPNQHTH